MVISFGFQKSLSRHWLSLTSPPPGLFSSLLSLSDLNSSSQLVCSADDLLDNLNLNVRKCYRSFNTGRKTQLACANVSKSRTDDERIVSWTNCTRRKSVSCLSLRVFQVMTELVAIVQLFVEVLSCVSRRLLRSKRRLFVSNVTQSRLLRVECD